MAAIASMPEPPANRTTSSWNGLINLPGYAQGAEGQRVSRDMVTVAERWQRPSAYLATLLPEAKASEPTEQITWKLPVACVLATVAVILIIAELVIAFGGLLLTIALVFGVAAYALFSRWIATRQNPSAFVRFLERIRQIIAYQGDPAR